MNKRIEWIDALKGFAILTVVIGHCADGILTSGMFIQYKTVLQALFDLIYAFHMPLFFIVSGFVFWLSKSYNKYKSKVFDFVIVYLTWDFLTWFVKFLLSSKVNKQVGLDELLGIFYHPIGPMWYLYVLIFFYLTFSLLGIKKITYKMLGVCAFVAVTDKALNFNIGVINQILYHAYFFIMGGYIAQTKFYLKLKKSQIYIALIPLIVNIYLYFNQFFLSTQIEVIKIFIVANLASIICFFIISRIPVNNMLKAMGEDTLQIYVIHCFVTAGLRIAFKAVSINSLLLYMILGTSFGVIIPIMIARFCRKFYYFNLVFQPTKTMQRLRSC